MWQPVSPEAKRQVHVSGLEIKVVVGMGWFSPLLVLTSAACFACQPGRLQQMKRWVEVSVFSEMKQNHHGINERPWCARHCESMHKLPPSSAMKLQGHLTIFHVNELIMPVWKQPCIELLSREEWSWFSGEFQSSSAALGAEWQNGRQQRQCCVSEATGMDGEHVRSFWCYRPVSLSSQLCLIFEGGERQQFLL